MSLKQSAVKLNTKHTMPYVCEKCLNSERFYRKVYLAYELDSEGNPVADVTGKIPDDLNEGVHCFECGSKEAVNFQMPDTADVFRLAQ